MDVRHLGATALITHLGELFMAGRFEEATRFWSFPCPIEVEGEMLVIHDACEFEAFLRRQRGRAHEAGLLALTPKVIAVELPRDDGRFRIWLRWFYSFAGRSEEAPDLSVFYMRRRPSGELSIEMMNLVHVPAEALSA